MESASRKKKRKTRATALEKERGTQQEEEGEVTPIFPLDGGAGQMTPPFPLDGNPSQKTQQLLVQVLATLLQQAGVGQ